MNDPNQFYITLSRHSFWNGFLLSFNVNEINFVIVLLLNKIKHTQTHTHIDGLIWICTFTQNSIKLKDKVEISTAKIEMSI